MLKKEFGTVFDMNAINIFFVAISMAWGRRNETRWETERKKMCRNKCMNMNGCMNVYRVCMDWQIALSRFNEDMTMNFQWRHNGVYCMGPIWQKDVWKSILWLLLRCYHTLALLECVSFAITSICNTNKYKRSRKKRLFAVDCLNWNRVCEKCRSSCHSISFHYGFHQFSSTKYNAIQWNMAFGKWYVFCCAMHPISMKHKLYMFCMPTFFTSSFFLHEYLWFFISVTVPNWMRWYVRIRMNNIR